MQILTGAERERDNKVDERDAPRLAAFFNAPADNLESIFGCRFFGRKGANSHWSRVTLSDGMNRSDPSANRDPCILGIT